MTCSLRTAVRRRLAADDAERGSLPFLMLVMILSVALGAVLLTTVVSQARTARFDESRVRSLDASQSGVDFALARIRGAVSGDDASVGDAGKLPCYTDQSGADGVLKFSVSIEYYRSNPAQLTQAQRSSSKMLCSSSVGTFDPASNSRAPRFALITSKGVDSSRDAGSGVSKGRTLETTYVFQTNDVNISGGQIRIYPASAASTPYCMDAGATPVEGSAVTLQACSTSNPAIDQQVFTYRSDLSIELVSSASPPTPGLCLDTNPTAHASNRSIVLKRCDVADENPGDPAQTFVCPSGFTPTSFKAKYPARTCRVSPYNQQWSVDDSAHLRGAATDQKDTDGFCIDAATQTAGVALLLQQCAGSTADPRQTWIPSPTTGPGAAGPGNKQIVNYAQFATCIDITDANVGNSFQILYTCKQNPNPDRVLWNQKVTPSSALSQGPSKVLLTVTTPAGLRYCLKSTLTAGGYPTLVLCPLNAIAPDSWYWTVNQRYATNDATSNELAYADRYTIKDSTGTLCLGPGDNSDLFRNAYYKIVTASCDGTTAQKWNADPSRLKATLTNTREIS